MKKFKLPKTVYIVIEDDEEYAAIAAVDKDDDPGASGYTVVAAIDVIHSGGSWYPGTSEEWIASIEEEALAAFMNGETSISL